VDKGLDSAYDGVVEYMQISIIEDFKSDDWN